jgi:hypothetical protein
MEKININEMQGREKQCNALGKWLFSVRTRAYLHKNFALINKNAELQPNLAVNL